MEGKYGEFVGVDNVYTARIIEDTAEAYLTETPVYLAPTGEIASDTAIENTPTYYDNAPGFNYTSEGVTTLTITFSGVPPETAAMLMGKTYDAASGRVIDSGEPTPPERALSFRFNKGPNAYRYYQYLKGTFSGGEESARTKEQNVEIRTYQMIFTAVVTSHKWVYGNDPMPRPIKRIFGETTDAAFDPTGWFSRVQTPDTVTPPQALALQSTVPENNATAVSVSDPIVVTYNNKISVFEAALMDAGTIVPCTITKDADGKIVTITLSAPLDSLKQHTLIITNATDIYGQTLKNNTIIFTTA